jgi:hypothetical protein
VLMSKRRHFKSLHGRSMSKSEKIKNKESKNLLRSRKHMEERQNLSKKMFRKLKRY